VFAKIAMGKDPVDLHRLRSLQPAGITRMFSADRDHEQTFISAAQAWSDLPRLISADREGSRMSLLFGKKVPNPLALAAINDTATRRETRRILAQRPYLFGEKTLLTRGRIFLDWARLTGHFGAAMERPWHEVPTALILFGSASDLYHPPRLPSV